MSIVERTFVRDTSITPGHRRGDVVLGDDWVSPESTAEREMRVSRARRGLFTMKASPLTRKIITFNLIALNILVAGILYLNSSRDSLVVQRASALVGEAELIADVFEAQLPATGPVSLAAADGVDVPATLENLNLRNGVEVFVFDTADTLVGQTKGTNQSEAVTALSAKDNGRTLISDGLTALYRGTASVIATDSPQASAKLEDQLRALIPIVVENGTQVDTSLDTLGGTVFSAMTPIIRAGAAVGVIAVASPAGEIDALVRNERERVLQMFVMAILVSIGLSMVLASTIANPLSDLAEAAELGRDRNSRKVNPGSNPHPGSDRAAR